MSPPSPLPPTTASTRGMLWIDGVGGYLVCWGERVVLGQPGQGRAAGIGPDIAIWGDLSRHHAAINRIGEGYTLEPLRTTKLDGRTLTGVTTLADGQRIGLGESVSLTFHQPHPWSRSARLELGSHHRPHPAADGVLLAAEVLILGSGTHCHVVCPGWRHEVLLVRQRGSGFQPEMLHAQDGGSGFQPEIHGQDARATGEEWSIRSTGQLFRTDSIGNVEKLANPARIAWGVSLQTEESRLTLEPL